MTSQVEFNTLYEIQALRSDGLRCAGTVDVGQGNETDAMKMCKSTFRAFRVRPAGIVHCQIHNTPSCQEHTGETWTFSQWSVVKL